MESPDLETVEMARTLVDEIIAGRSPMAAAVPYFAPTDIGCLTPAMKANRSSRRRTTSATASVPRFR